MRCKQVFVSVQQRNEGFESVDKQPDDDNINQQQDEHCLCRSREFLLEPVLAWASPTGGIVIAVLSLFVVGRLRVGLSSG